MTEDPKYFAASYHRMEKLHDFVVSSDGVLHLPSGRLESRLLDEHGEDMGKTARLGVVKYTKLPISMIFFPRARSSYRISKTSAKSSR